ncbi:hypothetical protein C8Q70DRAFT_1052957 [Cubamyces menziesii]|nr:hypothetical protein C8Q70DRAFT_1052957 [Cubamyces menziesii]
MSSTQIKMVGDAKRPCSTCIRSHSYAATHAPPGTDLPPHPECTYDESSEPQPAETQDSPKNRFERLESRINELEALLQEKEHAPGSRSGPASVNGSREPSSFIMGFQDTLDITDRAFPLDGHADASRIGTASALDDLAGVASFASDASRHMPIDALLFSGSALGFPPTSPLNVGLEVISTGWPKNLPNYSFLCHLVEAFFTFTPCASRMFHMSTFMTSLSLPPSHPKFPLPAILHAMCALGSMYTASVSPTPSPPLPSYCPGGGNALNSSDSDSFGEQQIRFAKDAIEVALRTTSDLFSVLQAQIVVSLWFWYNARWSEACMAFALSLRYAVPCGLNACPPFGSISSSDMSASSVIPPAANVIEDETRRNTFWFAYMMERHFAAINNFAMMLDDEDIAQMLPVRGDLFERGVLVPPSQRQWSYQPDVLTNHPEEQIDSFVLHVKATLLLSKIKIFNGRYRVKRHLGIPNMQPDPTVLPNLPSDCDRTQAVPAFTELDRLIADFKQSLPTKFKDPLYNGVIDVSMFTAISTVHFATIVLHEGHARIGRPACISSCRVLEAARAILNLLYEAYSTSHNLALLGVFPLVCWFVAGRVLVRFLKAAIDAQSESHITTLRAEVDFIRSVICKIGEGVPHAHHYGRMLNGYLAQTCGKEYVTPVSPPSLITSRNSSSTSSSPLTTA